MKGKLLILFFVILVCFSISGFCISISETQQYLESIGYTSELSGELLMITPNNCFAKYAYHIIDFLKYFMGIMAIFVLINVAFKYFIGESKELNVINPIRMIIICFIVVWAVPYAVGFITNTQVSGKCKSLSVNTSELGEKSIDELIRFYSR